MTLPELTEWEKTKNALHQSLQVLLMARLIALDPMPNALRHSLTPTPSGATTSELKFGGSLSVDFTRLKLIYAENGSEVFQVDLLGATQKSLAEKVFSQLAEAGHKLEPDFSRTASQEFFEIDAEQANDYAEVQWCMFQALARLKAGFIGMQTPVVVWPHGFDLSTLWFASGNDDHNDPHLNFGFSPGTPDVGQPYIYFYAYPVIEGLQKEMPSLMQWHTTWSTPGGVLSYDKLLGESDPEAVIVEVLGKIYLSASKILTRTAQ